MAYVNHSITPVLGLLVLVAASILVQFSLGVGLSSIVAVGLPWWAPEFGSLGDTVFVYSVSSDVFSYVVIPVLVFVLGYKYGKDR